MLETTHVTEWELVFAGTQGEQNLELAAESSCDDAIGTGELRVAAGYTF